MLSWACPQSDSGHLVCPPYKKEFHRQILQTKGKAAVELSRRVCLSEVKSTLAKPLGSFVGLPRSVLPLLFPGASETIPTPPVSAVTACPEQKIRRGPSRCQPGPCVSRRHSQPYRCPSLGAGKPSTEQPLLNSCQLSTSPVSLEQKPSWRGCSWPASGPAPWCPASAVRAQPRERGCGAKRPGPRVRSCSRAVGLQVAECPPGPAPGQGFLGSGAGPAPRRGVPQPCHALEVKREKRSSGGVRSSKFSNRVTNNSLCGLKFYYRFSKVY